MEQQLFTTFTKDDLKQMIKESILEAEVEKDQQEDGSRTFSINQVAKNLHRSHTTIKKLVMSGQLKTTSDGRRITAHELNCYLKK
jgi:hypothetical protein